MAKSQVSEEKVEKVEEQASESQLVQMAKILASAISEGRADADQRQKELIDAVLKAAPKKKIGVAERTVKTPFNPHGLKRKLSRPMFVNRSALDERYLHDSEIALLEELARLTDIAPGKYITDPDNPRQKLVTVFCRDNGAENELHIRYSNAEQGERYKLKGEAKNFTQILNRCVIEAREAQSSQSK